MLHVKHCNSPWRAVSTQWCDLLLFFLYCASVVAQVVKNLPAAQETQVPCLGQEDPLEEEWLPALAFLPGEFHGQRSLVGYSPWHCKESDTTERLPFHFLYHDHWGWLRLGCNTHWRNEISPGVSKRLSLLPKMYRWRNFVWEYYLVFSWCSATKILKRLSFSWGCGAL